MATGDPLADPGPLVQRIYAYVAYRVGDGPSAEDITSDVFERALRYRHTFDGRRGNAIGWLVGIAQRCILDAALADAPGLMELPEDLLEGDLEAITIRRLDLLNGLGRLSERDRDLIALRYGADLTARRVGEVMGMNPNAVEVAIHRALGRLRGLLSEGEADESVPLRAEPGSGRSG